MTKTTKRTKTIAKRHTDARLIYWSTKNSDFREAFTATRNIRTYGSFTSAVRRGAYDLA